MNPFLGSVGESLIETLVADMKLHSDNLSGISAELAELKLRFRVEDENFMRVLIIPNLENLVSEFMEVINREFSLKKKLLIHKPRVTDSERTLEVANISQRIIDLKREQLEWRLLLDNYKGTISDAFEQETRRLAYALKLLRTQLAIIRTQLGRKPDSELIDVKLPEKLMFDDRQLYFVNRNDSMKELVDILYHNFRKRSAGGGADAIALLDSVYGMGKTTFALNFLSLVARYWGNGNTKAKYEGVFSEELLGARTLHIVMNSSMAADMEKSIVCTLLNQVYLQWSFSGDIPETMGFFDAIDFITSLSPVFIVFDEFASAFQGTADVKDHHARDKFLIFVEKYCIPLLRKDRVYFVLCGRANFLSFVGQRPGSSFHYEATSPVRFARINLNPIRETYIAEILQKTIHWSSDSDGAEVLQSFQDTLLSQDPNLNIESYCSQLYNLTGGHPRTLLKVLTQDMMLKNPKNIDLEFELSDVQFAVDLYRDAVREMYEGLKSHRRFDLTSLIEGDEPKRPSREYIATRIFAGFGYNKKDTEIFITPPVMRVLDSAFMPFYDFVIRYSELNLLVDKSRVFEEMILKWFQSVFSKEDQTWGVLGDSFIPNDCILHGIVARLDEASRIDGKRVVPSKKARSTVIDDGGIRIEEMSNNLLEYIGSGYPHIYFPSPQSASPDIFIIPPVKGQGIIIGVAAKCWSGVKIPSSAVEDELKKFRNIIEANRELELKPRLLIICTTVPVSIETGGRPSTFVGKGALGQGSDELLIFNLTSDDEILKFCRLAVSSDDKAQRALNSIQNLIGYVHNKPSQAEGR